MEPAAENYAERYRQVADSLHMATIVIDTAGKILAVNERLKALLGDSSDPTGQPLSSLINVQLDPFGEKNFEVETTMKTSADPVPIMLSVGSLFRARRVLNVVDLRKLKEAESDRETSFKQIVEISNTVMEQAMALRDTNKELEERVRRRTADLRQAQQDALFMLAVASEAKDNDTGQHVRRIENICRALALEIGLKKHDADDIAYAAILHDVGKLQVPDAILNKAGPLDHDERFTMQQHTLAGERILAVSRFFEMAKKIARCHHENWDGSGYPEGLKGESIPLEARIVHVADVLDALTHSRVYKKAWPIDEAVAYLVKAAGTQFDPDIVHAVAKLHHRNQLVDVLGLETESRTNV